MKSPVRTTVIFALISGAMVVPLTLLLSPYLQWPTAFKIVLWADVALYGLLLARWGRAPMPALFFPMLILLCSALWPGTYHGFLFLSLGVLAWMRSGICFQYAAVRTLMAEAMTVFGSVAILIIFGAYTPFGWALNICLFFLVQSLYFFIVPLRPGGSDEQAIEDRFEIAAGEAAKIMEGI